MNCDRAHACKLAGFLILLLGLRASSGQLTCYFGSLDQAKRTLNQSLNDQTCAVKYSNRMNLTDGSSINTTYSLINPDVGNVSTWKFCLVFVHENSKSDHSCDHDGICQSDGVRRPFNYKGQLGSVFCCQTNRCNTYERATEDGSQSSICYSETGTDASCYRSRCMNQTTVAPNGTTQYKFGCATEKNYDPNSSVKDECQETPSPTGRTTTCFCTGTHCNRPATNLNSPSPAVTSKPAPLLYVTSLMVHQEHARSWGFVGTVAAVVLLVVLLLVLVVLVVRRFREHRAQHVTYTYTQLTADLAEERDVDDEYMIIG